MEDVSTYAFLSFLSCLADQWRSVGRLDDICVPASAENMVRTRLKSVITSSPLVSGVGVFGRGRSQVGGLIEPAIPVFDVVEFRNRVWCDPMHFSC